MTYIKRDGYYSGLLYAFRLRWPLVLCVALLTPVLAVTIDALRPASYTAESLVRVQDPGENPGQAGMEEVSRERLREIRIDVGPEEVSRSAMEELGWEGGIEEFEDSLEVGATEGGTLEVSFSGETPERASEGANAYAEAFVVRVERLDEYRLAGGVLSASAEVAREAQPPREAGIGTLAVGLAALVPGVLAGGVLALMLGGRDRRLWDARDVELTLGARVLGVVPEFGAGEPESRGSQGGRAVR